MSRLNREASTQLHPVGVVMRSNAPLVDDLLQDKEVFDYSVAIEEDKTRRTLAATIGVASSLLALVSFLQIFKLPK